jgi:hypothetical protein
VWHDNRVAIDRIVIVGSQFSMLSRDGSVVAFDIVNVRGTFSMFRTDRRIGNDRNSIVMREFSMFRSE